MSDTNVNPNEYADQPAGVPAAPADDPAHKPGPDGEFVDANAEAENQGQRDPEVVAEGQENAFDFSKPAAEQQQNEQVVQQHQAQPQVANQRVDANGNAIGAVDANGNPV